MPSSTWQQIVGLMGFLQSFLEATICLLVLARLPHVLARLHEALR